MDNEALIAVRRGDLSRLKKLLQRIDIDAQDENGRTLVHHAASDGRHEVVECLLKNGANVLVTSHKNNTGLHIAVSKSESAVVKAILENVPRMKLRNLLDAKTRATGTTALHVAAKANCSADVLFLLEYGANFEMTNYAGRKPIDLAESEDIRKLFRLIDSSFEKAKYGAKQLSDDLEGCDPRDFTSVVNCRNNDGRTLLQLLVINEHYKIASNVLWFRVDHSSESECAPLHDPDRKREVEKLAKDARDCRDFWEAQKEAMTKLMFALSNDDSARDSVFRNRAAKLGADALRKAHEVLLAYRRFEGEQRSLTADPRMKSLEEAIEALGYDPETLLVVAGDNASYFHKLPDKLKDNVGSFVDLMDSTIDASIDFYLGYIYAMQHFNAVHDEDVDKVEQLIDKRVVNHGVGHDGRTALYIAVEKGHEQMVRVLLESGAGVYYELGLSPVYVATKKGYHRIVQMLLENVHDVDLHAFIDSRYERQSTALHAAAELGNLDVVKVLLKFGATYQIFNGDNLMPLDVSSSERVRDFLKLVDECFRKANRTEVDLVQMLEAMSTGDFLAVAGARNRLGETILNVLAKAKANDMSEAIANMIDRTKFSVL